jgi:hypothetical protein
MTYHIEFELDDEQLERYQWALSELPYRTDESWEQHLKYAVYTAIDKVIDEANRYREWRGFPGIGPMRVFDDNLKALINDAKHTRKDKLVESLQLLANTYSHMVRRLPESDETDERLPY